MHTLNFLFIFIKKEMKPRSLGMILLLTLNYLPHRVIS